MRSNSHDMDQRHARSRLDIYFWTTGIKNRRRSPLELQFFLSTLTHHTYIDIMGWFSDDSDQAQAYDQVFTCRLPLSLS